MFCGKTTLSECPRFSSLQQLLSSQSGLQQKWRGVDGAVSLGRGVGLQQAPVLFGAALPLV